MSRLLTSEIVKRILLDVGATIEIPFNGIGLTDPNFIIDKKIKIRYNEDREEEARFDRSHNIYSGKLKIGESSLRAILVDLSVNEMKEFLFLFKMDNLPCHAIRLYYDIEDIDYIDLNFIKIFNESNEVWADTSIYMQSMILSNFEKFVSYGLLWENNKEYKDLYKLALTLIS